MAQTKKNNPLAGISRRELLKLSPVLLTGAFAFEGLRDPLLAKGVAFSDWAAGKLYRGMHPVPTFSNSDVVPFEKFPYNGYDVLEPELDLENWKLTVTGAVDRPGEYSLQQIMALPKVTQNVRHVCVEGWDVVGNYAGTRVADFLNLVGAQKTSRFMAMECADDYYESVDMASAVHPQTLFCYEMYGKPLDRGHGAPLRLLVPTKLGYKQAKYITKIEISNVLKPERGYWEDQGYSWFGGI